MGGPFPTTTEPGHGGVRRRRPPPRQIAEIEDGGTFAVAMQDLERTNQGLGDRRQRVVVMVRVSDDGKRWDDWVEFWSGRWRPSFDSPIPTPTEDTLRDEARRAGTRYADVVIRSTIW